MQAKTREYYKSAIQAARSEMEEMLAKRAAIDKRLQQLKQTMDGLGALLEEVPDADSSVSETESDQSLSEGIGISDAIRVVLSEVRVPLSPSEIKTFLSKRGFKFHEYANPMAVVHNTLKRLALQEEVTTLEANGGQTLYTITPRDPVQKLGEYGKFPGSKQKNFEQRMAEGNNAIERSSAFKKGLLDKK